MTIGCTVCCWWRRGMTCPEVARLLGDALRERTQHCRVYCNRRSHRRAPMLCKQNFR